MALWAACSGITNKRIHTCYRNKDKGHQPVDLQPCLTRTKVQTPRGLMAQVQASPANPQDNSTTLLPTVVRACSDRVLPPQLNGGPTETRVRQVLVVQLWQEADTPLPFH